MNKDISTPLAPLKKFRTTLRLTFRVADGKINMVSYERLPMICPPFAGEPPRAGYHSGDWIELRDRRETALFYRLIDSPFIDSVDVHSPDGKIKGVTGPVKEKIFEVLLPDDDQAASIVVMGTKPGKGKTAAKKEKGTEELVRFDFPK